MELTFLKLAGHSPLMMTNQMPSQPFSTLSENILSSTGLTVTVRAP